MKPIQRRSVYPVFVRLAVLGFCWVAATPAAAQLPSEFVTGFEPPPIEEYQGSPDGVPVTGQQGWYIPTPPGGSDLNVYTYLNNALGLPINPPGLLQFLGGEVACTDFLRAQHDVDFSAGGIWTAFYHVAAGFHGTPPAPNNIGSFSLQGSGMSRNFIALNVWEPGMEGTQWSAGYVVYDATGETQTFVIPGEAWHNLAVNHWYTQATAFDFDSNRILLVAIVDLETPDIGVVVFPPDWYLAGGATGGGLPLPTAVRFFVGGNDPDTGEIIPGNLQGWDNLAVSLGLPLLAPNSELAPLSISLAPGAVTQ